MEQPVGDERQAVVVVRIALAEETQEVFVDEVEVPEAVDVAGCWMVADGMALVGVRESGEDVPRRGDGEEEQDSGEGLQARASDAIDRSAASKGTAAPAKKTGAMSPLVSVARASAAHIP